MSALIPKSEFVGIEAVAHLAVGGEAPTLTRHIDAAARFMLDKGVGMPGRDRMFGAVRDVRVGLGRLLGVVPEDIALMLNAAAGLHAVASGIDWRPGDNVVMARSEFPSLIHVWQALRGPPIEIRQVGSEMVPTIADYEAAIDSRTRVLAVSHVSYLSGARQDLGALRALADRHGARLVVDASHALGVVPVPGGLCDVVVSCSYKWLLATHGIGVFYVNSARWPELVPNAIGWHSVIEEQDWQRRSGYHLKFDAQRFEQGNVAFLSAYILQSALDRLLELSPAQAEAHALGLGKALMDGLKRLGLDVTTPTEPGARAGNICFATADSEGLEAELRRRGVLVWGGDGRIRISVHAYNDESDVDRALAALAQLI
jgi:selenocysteine lyase/cysteine desulfurase